MKRNSIFLIFLLLIATSPLPSCKKEVHELRVGLVSGFGSLHDGGFNQQALNGLKNATDNLPIAWVAREAATKEDIEANIWYFARNDFEVVISLGFDAATPTIAAAKAYPGTKFILLDYESDSLPANLSCVVYDIDQASFPCGFLAAWWSSQKDPSNPSVAYVAGPKIPQIDQFITSFGKGIEYFNKRYSKNVALEGVNASTFTDTLVGASLADSLLLRGADVMFACGGNMGNGALYKAKEYRVCAIGVDTDQYFTIPAVAPWLLTSCMKRLDVSVEMELNYIFNNQFHGGMVQHYSLTNYGVDLAPYHDYDTLISNTIKQEILAIKSGIKNGTISTGWPPSGGN